jgi:hypothetical protein
LVFLPTASLLNAQTQEIIPLSSSLYAEIDALYLIQGLGSPSTARPWTKYEAALILHRIDPIKLHGAAQSTYDHIAHELAQRLRFGFDSKTRFNVQGAFNIEMYAHSNTEDYVLEQDWLYNYTKRKPLFFLDMALSFDTHIFINTDIQYGRNRVTNADIFHDVYPQGIGAIVPPYSSTIRFVTWSQTYSSAFKTNIVSDIAGDFDYAWPKRADFVFGGTNWNVVLGRDRISWGNGHSGNFIFDDHVDYNDFIRYSFFSERFKAEFLYAFFLSDPETYQEAFRTFMTHRLEFRLLNTLSLTVSENIMYLSNNVNIKYLNPAFFYHNINERSLFNAIAHAELDWAFKAGFNLYSQFVLDQARSLGEVSFEADAWGILAGIEYGCAVGNGLLTVAAEGAYTTPVLYRRDKIDFLRLNVGISNTVGRYWHFDYIAYPYGGDSIVGLIDAAYTVPGIFDLNAKLFALKHGAMNIFLSHNADGDNTQRTTYSGSTPSGSAAEISTTFGLSLHGTINIPRFSQWLTLSVWAELDLFLIENKLMIADTVYHKEGTVSDIQAIVGMRISF